MAGFDPFNDHPEMLKRVADVLGGQLDAERLSLEADIDEIRTAEIRGRIKLLRALIRTTQRQPYEPSKSDPYDT